MAATSQIYALFDPRGGGIRYIGKTVNAARRLKDHLRETRRKTPLYSWIEKLRKEGVTPCMAIIANCITDNWEDVERELISQWLADGQRLLNLAEGGDQPFCPPEVRTSNANKLNAKLASDPKAKFIREAKRRLAIYIKDPRADSAHKEKIKGMMRECAAKRPELFGSWANV